jgi:hypothetical protein
VKRTTTAVGAVVLAVLALLGLSACSKSRAVTTSGSCGFIVGTGQDQHDKKLHKIIYPGQNIELDGDSNGTDYEELQPVPCTPRTYIVTNGEKKNANGDVIGDRHNPSVGYTKDGVQILVGSTVDWTLNQSDDAMRAFFELCFKFTCASQEDKGGNVNSSTPGWNAMLGETFSFVVDKLVLEGSAALGDDVWQKHDPKAYTALSDYVAAHFADAMRPKTGYNNGNMFCGPGSGWKDPENPGAKDNVFNCTAVTINVDTVDRGQVDDSDGTKGAETVNAQRLATAKNLYGDQLAPQVLADLDRIAACKEANTICSFSYAGSAPAVAAR